MDTAGTLFKYKSCIQYFMARVSPKGWILSLFDQNTYFHILYFTIITNKSCNFSNLWMVLLGLEPELASDIIG